MPYMIAPAVREGMPALWGEGASPYEKRSLYRIDDSTPGKPPVNYDEHVFRPHSICHYDAPSHIIQDGAGIDGLLKHTPQIFYGDCVVIRLKNPDWRPHSRAPNIQHWQVSLKTFLDHPGIQAMKSRKALFSFEGAESHFFQNPNRAFTLSPELCEYLVREWKIDLMGTIWKSADFEPQSKERPVHRSLFESGAGILECLDLSAVPEGRYFIVAYPIPIVGASEAPVVPVLFEGSLER